jgi:hypothetical protein
MSNEKAILNAAAIIVAPLAAQSAVNGHLNAQALRENLEVAFATLKEFREQKLQAAADPEQEAKKAQKKADRQAAKGS